VASKTFTPAEVRVWLDAVQADLRRIEEKVRPLEEKQRQLEAREELLRDLLRSFESDANGSGDAASVPAPSGSVGQYVVERSVEILRDAGEPLHINDLYSQFRERGFSIPGAGKPVNLIVHLRQAHEIVSPQRGIYGLREDLGDVRPRAARKRTTTSRRRRKG